MAGALNSILSVNENEIKSMNGMRSIAIIFVMLYHFDMAIRAMGIFDNINATARNIHSNMLSGVDIFFILSGFLISLELSAAWQKKSHFFSRFYIKRFFRIVPAYYFLLILSFALMFFKLSVLKSMPPGEEIANNIKTLEMLLHNTLFDVFFIANIFSGGIPHLWAISTLQQFYIVFPVIGFFVYFKRGFSGKIAILGALYIAFLAMRFVAAQSAGTWSGKPPALFSEHMRFESIIVGIMLMEVYVHKKNYLQALRGYRANLIMLSGLIILAVSHIYKPESAALYTSVIRFNLFSLGYGMIVLSLLAGVNFLDRFLSMRIFVPLSRVSFTMYLWHIVTSMFTVGLFSLKTTEMNYLNFYGIFMVYLAGTFVISLVLYLIIEYPFHRLKDFILRRIPAS